MSAPLPFVNTTWFFETSSGFEGDVFFLGFGHGSVYIYDSTDPSKKIYRLYYTGMGLTTGKSPIHVLGGSGSTAAMPNHGTGPIRAYKGVLSISDFVGWGTIYTGSENVGTGNIEEGNYVTRFYFPDDTYGTLIGIQIMTPVTVAGTVMKVRFSL